MDERIIANTLSEGKLVVMRSDTIYGVFALAKNQQVVEKLHMIRGRAGDQGFIVLADSVATIANMISLSDQVEHRLENIWAAPSATSVILLAKDTEFPWLADTRSSKATICFRVPNDDRLKSLLKLTGPLCAPSANLPDQLPASNVKEAKSYFGDLVDLYVDGGECDNNTPSRIIKFSGSGIVETIRSDGHNHPEDFVITRRRKLYKFAKFDELGSCFHVEEWLLIRDSKLPQLGYLVVEVGAGSALFSVELARRSPGKTFVAIDIKGDRLYQGAREAARLGLKNIYFVRSDIAKINDVIPSHKVNEVWLTFPDPYPRKPDSRHRLTASRYLNYYRQILQPDGILNFKTDSLKLFEWSLEQFEEDGWRQQFCTYDLHNSDSIEEAKIMTSYERRFVEDGLNINFVQLTP